MKKSTIILTFLFMFNPGFLSPTQAQVERVEIRVDGLACPFCAYGLEKKLKEVDGVAKVQINVDKGLAALDNKEGKSIAVEKLEPVVADAGFASREIEATVLGKVGQSNGTPVFSVTGTEVKVILTENETLKRLQSKLERGDNSVRVTGRLSKETPEGHHAHPYTLTVSEFEVLK